MKLSYFATPLVAAALLLSTLGCSKKDDPATPSTTGTSSYQLDATTITSQATASVSTSTSGGLSYDYLRVQLTTTPQPASGAEVLRLYFTKQTGQPNGAYQLFDIVYYKGNSSNSYTFLNTATTLTTTSGGGFSGTFSAKASNAGGTTSPYTAITNGVFTDARP